MPGGQPDVRGHSLKPGRGHSAGFLPRRCPRGPIGPAGLLYAGTLLSWTRMEEPFAATLPIIVPAAGRGHVRTVVDHPS
jgi:hypothetical protein